MSDIELDILPTGEVRFSRNGDKISREMLFEILENMIDDPEELRNIKEFLDGADDIEKILGDDILCG